MTSLLKREKPRFLVEDMSLSLQTGEGPQALSPDNTPLKISGSFQVSQQPDTVAEQAPDIVGTPQAPCTSLPCYKGLPSGETVRKLVEAALLRKVWQTCWLMLDLRFYIAAREVLILMLIMLQEPTDRSLQLLLGTRRGHVMESEPGHMAHHYLKQVSAGATTEARVNHKPAAYVLCQLVEWSISKHSHICEQDVWSLQSVMLNPLLATAHDLERC